jgi:hypothetical protein
MNLFFLTARRANDAEIIVAAFEQMGSDEWLTSNVDPDDEAWATFMGNASGVAL